MSKTFKQTSVRGAVAKHLGGYELQGQLLVMRDAVPRDGDAAFKDRRAQIRGALHLQCLERPSTLILLLLVHQDERLLLLQRSLDFAQTIVRDEVPLRKEEEHHAGGTSHVPRLLSV